MEKELEYKIFYEGQYSNIAEMEADAKKYMEILRNKFTEAIVTKEFYKGKNLIVRATKVKKEVIIRRKYKEKEIDRGFERTREER